jgi:hypothetical protein
VDSTELSWGDDMADPLVLRSATLAFSGFNQIQRRAVADGGHLANTCAIA